jgi:glycosyltransferase involved in cell wall biosynthesis
VTGRRLALVTRDLSGGGLERILLVLAREFAEHGNQVDLVVGRSEGALIEKIPEGVQLVTLKASPRFSAHLALLRASPRPKSALLPILTARKPHWFFNHFPALVEYFAAARPDTALALYTPVNLAAVWARRASGWRGRLVVNERNLVSAKIAFSKRRATRAYPALIRASYPLADAIVSVTDRVADDLATLSNLPRDSITTIYNPVIRSELADLAAESVSHPYFAPGAPPLVLGLGRLSSVKDFATLVRAFARLREHQRAHLMILGDGGNRAELEALVQELGVAQDVALPGFVSNPYPYIARAAAVAVTSRHEGVANVLCEALALGRPAVSTDCPGGPREVLCDGRYGPLVPVGDSAALASAIERLLDDPPDPDDQRKGAERFHTDRAIPAYLDVLTPGWRSG